MKNHLRTNMILVYMIILGTQWELQLKADNTQDITISPADAPKLIK